MVNKIVELLQNVGLTRNSVYAKLRKIPRFRQRGCPPCQKFIEITTVTTSGVT